MTGRCQFVPDGVRGDDGLCAMRAVEGRWSPVVGSRPSDVPRVPPQSAGGRRPYNRMAVARGLVRVGDGGRERADVVESAHKCGGHDALGFEECIDLTSSPP